MLLFRILNPVGHYSYECTAAQQDRPYVSRPSRTQQLSDPKLAPKIVEAEPKPEGARCVWLIVVTMLIAALHRLICSLAKMT